MFIHSVDAQSSANGGIIIQVIGEMSNKGEPWRKFVQTFFLAEQPNGYFVLNDIFRFLKEETVEDEPSEEAESVDAVQVHEPVMPSALATPTPIVPVPAIEPSADVAVVPGPVVVAEEVETPSAPESEPEPEQQTNGVHEPTAEPLAIETPAVEAPSQPEPEPLATASPPPVTPPAPAQLSLAPSPAPPAQPQTAQPPVATAPAPAPAPAHAPAPAPAHAPTPAHAPAPVAPRPSAPAAPKTWANLAATGKNKWGAAVAQEARGMSEAPAASNSPAPAAPSSTPQSPAPHGRQQNQPHQPHPAFVAATSVPTAQCFIKVCRSLLRTDDRF